MNQRHDVILTNKESCFVGTASHPFSGSDHNIVTAHLLARGLKPKFADRYIQTRSFKKISDDMVRRSLNCLDIWGDFVEIEDVNSCVECLNHVINGLMDIVCPETCEISSISSLVPDLRYY